MAEGLSRLLEVAKRYGGFRGLLISHVLYISHLLFVDDILIFRDGSRRDVENLFQGMALFMQINEEKSTLTCANLEDPNARYLATGLPFQVWDLDDGLKYLGFHLKPNDYRKMN